MQYLIIQKTRWATGYDVKEFETREELADYLLNTDTLAKDIIVAQRLGVNISFGEYIAPVEVPEVPEVEVPEVDIKATLDAIFHAA